MWPIDASTDLTVILEQIPDSIQWLDSGLATGGALDFFEQGIQRCLQFERQQSGILIHCTSRTDWQPLPVEEIVTHAELQKMLKSLLQTFVDLAKIACPSDFNHPWFQEWLQQEALRDYIQF